MTIYIALLRGINVGGKNMIKMADLKRIFESIGLMEVQTYIQSGNVLFQSEDDEDALREKIELEIERVFGFSVAVVLRTAAELEHIILNCPFTEAEVIEAEASSDAECLYVALLTHVPAEEKLEKLNTYHTVSDEYRVAGRDLYLLFHNSIRNSKLASQLQKLGVTITVRNWKTMSKLVSLTKDMGNL